MTNSIYNCSDESHGGLAVYEMIIIPLSRSAVITSQVRDGNVSLRIYDAYISNIDSSVSPTRFLVPMSESIIEMPLNIGVHIVVEPKLSDTQIYNEVIDVQNIKTGGCKNHRFLSFTATPPLGGSSKFRKRIFL